MTYTITKHIKIEHEEDGWSFDFTADELGVTDAQVVKCATQDEYLNRLYYAFDNTTDPKLRQFIYTEIRKIHVQRGTW